MSEQKSQFNDGLPEILSPTYDHIFKRIFANVPDFLKELLKSVPGVLEDGMEIVVTDPHIYPESPDGKIGILDIKVVVKSKKVINVEMQRKKVANTRARVVSYLSGMIIEQMVAGDDEYNINRVISIVITTHELIAGDNVYHHRFRLSDLVTRTEFTDLLEVHTLELSKLPLIDDGSNLWNWMKFLTVKTKEELAMVAEKSAALKKAARHLLDMSEDAATRRYLESIRWREMDDRAMLREARAEGVVEGEARGKAEEIEETIKLIEMGHTVDEIKKILAEKQATQKRTTP